MSFQLKTKYVIIAIIGVFLALFIIGYIIGQRRGESASNSVISALNSEIRHYIVRIGDDSVYIAQKEQEIKTVKQAKKDGDIRNEELRKLNLKQVNEISRLKLRIDTLLSDISHTGQIIHTDTVYIDSISHNAILLPFSFNKTDQWLNLQGKFNNQGKLDISLKMDVPVDLWTGIEKKSKKPICVITTKSPYVNTLSIKSQKFDLPKINKWSIGFSVGYGIVFLTEIKTAPFAGITLTRSIVRF
jgi:hypothetical protein